MVLVKAALANEYSIQKVATKFGGFIHLKPKDFPCECPLKKKISTTDNGNKLNNSPECALQYSQHRYQLLSVELYLQCLLKVMSGI